MRLVDVTEKTENAFFRCLHLEIPEDREVTAVRRRWYERHKDKGLRAKVLMLEDDQIAGLCQYLPIEHSPLLGEDLLVILCFWVHGYEHLVGNQQGRGMGRFMLHSIENDARSSGARGVAAWGMDWEINWMPVAFYERMGYARVDSEDKVVVLWKPFGPDAGPPSLRRLTLPPQEASGKVKVTVATSGWCSGCQKLFNARKAVAGLEDMVEYEELDPPEDATLLQLGTLGGIFLDGKAFKPYEPPSPSDEVRAEILRLYSSAQKR